MRQALLVPEATSDVIEVRWCCNSIRANEDVLTDLVNIWVL